MASSSIRPMPLKFRKDLCRLPRRVEFAPRSDLALNRCPRSPYNVLGGLQHCGRGTQAYAIQQGICWNQILGITYTVSSGVHQKTRTLVNEIRIERLASDNFVASESR